MTANAGRVTIGLCNASNVPLLIWLEPWTGEFHLPPRGEPLLDCSTENPQADPTPELDFAEEIITIWGVGGSTIAVFINGVDQKSFSGKMACPDMGPLTSRKFVDIVFGGSPEARPGGLPLQIAALARRESALARLLRRFRLR